MSEINNNQIEAQLPNEELMKHTKAELVDLLEKEQKKVEKHKKEKSDLRKENKLLEEGLEKAKQINENNENYLQGLTEKLNDAEKRLQEEGQTMQNLVDSLSETLGNIETTIKLGRKSIQFNLLERG